jgi:hypothetical protein
MPVVQIEPSQLALRRWLQVMYRHTVAEFRDWWELNYDAELTVDPAGAGDDWKVCGTNIGTYDKCEAVPVDGVPLTIYASEHGCPPVHGGGPPPEEFVYEDCPTCQLHLTWDYEQATLNDTTGSHAWGGNYQTTGGLYNAGWDGTAFAANGTNHDWVGLNANNHLPVAEGQLVTLDVLFNNRSDSQTSEYQVAWYDDPAAVTAFLVENLLVCGGHGNSWQQYHGEKTAPSGAVAFAVRMERLSGHDNAVLCALG